MLPDEAADSAVAITAVSQDAPALHRTPGREPKGRRCGPTVSRPTFDAMVTISETGISPGSRASGSKLLRRMDMTVDL